MDDEQGGRSEVKLFKGPKSITWKSKSRDIIRLSSSSINAAWQQPPMAERKLSSRRERGIRDHRGWRYDAAFNPRAVLPDCR
jgi:hypothetical protein